ncbi:MAG: hypothetical protein LBE72_02715 [Rickettsia sp.]|nr:hypothetical protein [Rickettsia sp.]
MLPQFNNLPNAQAQAPAYNYVDRDDEDALDSLPNARVQRPMHNDLNEQDAFGTTMDIYNREVARGRFGGYFNDARAGNHQFNNFRDDEDEDALDSLPNARAQRPMHNDLNEQDEFGTMAIYKRGVEQGGFGGDFNDARAGNNQFDNFNEEEENTFNSFANFAIHEPIYNDLGREELPVPKARTSLAQSKSQEAAITQPRNSDEEVKKINKWLEDNKLPTLSSYSTILLKKYYQYPSQKDYLGNICVQQSLFGQDRQNLISLITGESIIREKFLSELDNNKLEVSSSTEKAIMQFLTSGKPLNWSTIDEDAAVQIFIGEELYKYKTLKDAGKAREYTMDYKAWQHANETTTNIAARVATNKLQAEQVAEQAKIQQLLKDYPNTKPVFKQLQELNLGYSQISRVAQKIHKFLSNPNSDKGTFNAELSTALVLNCSDYEFNLVHKIFTTTISCKEKYDHNGNAGYLNEDVGHNAGYYYDHDDYTINLLGEEGI